MSLLHSLLSRMAILSGPTASHPRSEARALEPLTTLEDPRLKATFGPLRLLALDARNCFVGRAPDNDVVLTGRSALLASRRHCKLIWNGYQTTITDLQSMNGTWVDGRRLADGEVRVLHNKDSVICTPLPLDNGPNSNAYFECTIKGLHPFAFVYTEYEMDDLGATLSPAGRVLRRSLAELSRVRQIVRSLQPEIRTAVLRQDKQAVKMYRGPLNRPERPQTAYYVPPPPIDLTPDLHRDKRLMRAVPVRPGLEDPEGVTADHPDIIWHNGVRYKHVPGTRAPPFEMQQWSNYYNLPVGLHFDWPLFSSVVYGVPLPAKARNLSSSLSRREEAYAKFRWAPDELINGIWTPTPVPASSAAPPTFLSSSPSPHRSEPTSGPSPAIGSFDGPDVSRSALSAGSLELASAASASHFGGPSGLVAHAGLKRPRSPDDDVAERSAKRVALAASIAAARGIPSQPPLIRGYAPKTPSCASSPPARPRDSSRLRDTIYTPSPAPAALLASTRERKPRALDDVPDARPVDARDAKQTMRKRKRQGEAEVVDVDAVELEGHSMTRVAATSEGPTSPAAQASDALRTLSSHAAPRKRRRVTRPLGPTRRSLRVREKAAAVVQGS